MDVTSFLLIYVVIYNKLMYFTLTNTKFKIINNVNSYL